MATYLFTYAQSPDLSGLYKNLGIKLLKAEKGSRTGTSYRLEADSIYFLIYIQEKNCQIYNLDHKYLQ